MQISIGGIFAKCPACGSNDFAAAGKTANQLVCAGCATPVVYGELIGQIGGEAVKRAMAARQRALGAEQPIQPGQPAHRARIGKLQAARSKVSA